MIKKENLRKSFYFLTLLLAVATVAVACTYKQQQQAVDTITEDEMTEADSVEVALSAQNNSGQSGTATLTEEDGQTRVVVSLNNAPAGTPQPAHIHLSSCATIGGVKYPLTSLVNGTSSSLVPVSLDYLLDSEQLSINVHKSAAEVSVYVACGDLPYQGVMEDKSAAQADDKAEGDDSIIGDDSAMVSEAKVFNVGGVNFAFDVKEIRVKKGDRVNINFTSNGGFHDWVVNEFDARTSQVNTGESSSVEFVADKAGTFEYYCSVGSHRQMGMVGKLIVE